MPDPSDSRSRADGRIERLESLRGIAATAVLVSHCFLVVPWMGEGIQRSLIRGGQLWANGNTALVVFFVISGYVLGLSLDKGVGQPRSFTNFYLRRIYRIYPAHLVALGIISIVLSSFYHPIPFPQSTEIFHHLFPESVRLVDWLFNSLLLKVNLNGIAWSLALEMGISTVFPIFYLISRRSPIWARVVVLVALIGISFSVETRIEQAGQALISQLHGPAFEVGKHFLYCFRILNKMAFYGWLFFLGLSGGPIFEKLIAKLEGRLGTIAFWLAFVFAVGATLFTGGKLTGLSLLIRGLGATFIVFSAVFMQTRNLPMRILDRPFIRRLGAVSYSFYLYHFIVHYCVAQVLFRFVHRDIVEALPFFFDLTVIGVSFWITYWISVASYRFVEAPMIAYSKRVTSRTGEPSAA